MGTRPMATTTKGEPPEKRDPGVAVPFMLPYKLLLKLEVACSRARKTRSQYVRELVADSLDNTNKKEK